MTEVGQSGPTGHHADIKVTLVEGRSVRVGDVRVPVRPLNWAGDHAWGTTLRFRIALVRKIPGFAIFVVSKTQQNLFKTTMDEASRILKL